jgi:hypothetical protein
MRKRRSGTRRQRELAVRDGLDGPSRYDLFIVGILESWARRGLKPKYPERFQISPETADVVLGHLSAKALAVQSRALDRAIASDAGQHEIDVGTQVARNVLDRRLGKPVERILQASNVRVEFSGLNPDAFPSEPREARAEVVEINGDAGTEIDDSGQED